VPQPRLRVGLVASQLMGLAMARFIVRMESIASADSETLIACYAPTIQRYLTGPLPGDHAARPSRAKTRGRRALQA
jgi:tetracycline repressor-like protein